MCTRRDVLAKVRKFNLSSERRQDYCAQCYENSRQAYSAGLVLPIAGALGWLGSLGPALVAQLLLGCPQQPGFTTVHYGSSGTPLATGVKSPTHGGEPGSPGRVAAHDRVGSTDPKPESRDGDTSGLTREPYAEEEESPIKIGHRVEISPNYDLWMKGAKQGIIKSIKEKIARVKMDHPEVKTQLKIPVSDLTRRRYASKVLDGHRVEISTGVYGWVPGEKRHTYSQVNPWAVCHASVGRKKSSKFERCVQEIKSKTQS